MCDIKEKTQFKTMTVYKAVRVSKGKYLSPFARTPINLGSVPEFKKFEVVSDFFNPRHPLHGKISGFAKKQDAITLANDDCFPTPSMKILKIKLGGIILMGSTNNICYKLRTVNNITYAGSEILSIEEL